MQMWLAMYAATDRVASTTEHSAAMGVRAFSRGASEGARCTRASVSMTNFPSLR